MKKIIVVLAVLITVLAGTRYYKINSGIPKKYYEDKYSINEWVDVGNSKIKIEEYDISENLEDNTKVEVLLSVKNLDPNFNINYLTNSILSIGGNQSIFSGIVSEEDLNDEKKIQMCFEFYRVKVENGDEVRFNIARDLYLKQVKDMYYDNKLYSKYILLETA